MKTNQSLHRLGIALLLCVPLLVAEECETHYNDLRDLMLHGDPLGFDGKPAAIVPFAPGIDPGDDGKYGTRDDIVLSAFLGDIDIRVLTVVNKHPLAKTHGKSGRWFPIAVAEPLGAGEPIPFFVTPSDGSPSVPGGHMVPAPSLNGNMVLGVAFADLDGDGYIGITHLDGDLTDAEIEEHELEPIGRRLARMFVDQHAYGKLHVAAGGPPGAELDVVVGAIALTGGLDPGNPDSFLPTGTAVMTRLPFHPNLVTKYRKGGAPSPDGLFALEFGAGVEPDPDDPRMGERFTLQTDDSDPTLGTAQARSGAFARMGIGRRVSGAATIGRRDRLRPGLAADGARILYQILDRLPLSPDGAASTARFDLLPLDRLGNVTSVKQSTVVTLSTTAGVRILSPDVDGDPTREALVFSGTVGVPIVLDDESSESGSALLVIESGDAFSRIEVVLSSLDVDGSGTVDSADLEILKESDSDREGKGRFDPSLDLNGDGRIDEADLAIALEQQSVPAP